MHRSFAKRLGGEPIRYERKILDTVHGDRAHNCAIYEIELKDVGGKYTLNTEVATLSKLTTVRNPQPEILQEQNQHLKGIEFSDISDDEDLEIQMILGIEDLCKIKTLIMIWRPEGKPLSEETKLGWTLFGPINIASQNFSEKCSLLFTRPRNKLNRNNL